MKKVILVGPCPPPEGGTTIPFKLLVDYIRENADVEVVVIDTESGQKDGVPVYSPLVLRPFFRILYEYILSVRKTDILIISGSQRFVATFGSLCCLINTVMLGKETYIHIAGSGFYEYYRSKVKSLRIIIKYCLSHASVVAVQTQSLYIRLSKELSNLAHIPNWIDVNQVRSSSCETKERGFLNGGKFRLVFLGEVMPEKGILELLGVFSQIKKVLSEINIDLSLDIFGRTKADSEKDVLNAIKSIPQGLKYHGFVQHEELMSLLASYDVLVLPTKFDREGYPAVLLEAMANGLPIIATNQGGISEIVKNGINGIIYEVNDNEGLRNAIVEMATRPESMRQMSNNSYESAKEYDVDVVLRKLCKIFGVMLKR